MKALLLTCFLGTSVMAAVTQPIQIDHYPYVGSLGSNAKAVERALIKEAVKVCGSLQNVKRLDDVRLEMQTSSVTDINLNGTAGAPNFHSVFMFNYPRVTGSANVECHH